MILLLKNSENESDFSKIMISNKTHYLHKICFSILINTVILKNMYSCTVYDKIKQSCESNIDEQV